MGRFSTASEASRIRSVVEEPDGTATITSSMIGAGSVPTSEPEFLRFFGYDPEVWQLVGGKIGGWRKEQRDGNWLASVQFSVEQRPKAIDPVSFEQVYAAVDKAPPLQPLDRSRDGHYNSFIEDWQTGKVDIDGGTKELLVCLRSYREQEDAYLASLEVKPKKIWVWDLGDLIESSQNVASQRRDNDLHDNEQVVVAAREVTEFVLMYAKYAPVTLISVPSNHGAVRDGKDYISNKRGRSDYGISINQHVENAIRLSPYAKRVSFIIPEKEQDDFVVVEQDGVLVGGLHGEHLKGLDGVDNWFAKQHKGNTRISKVGVLNAAHRHNPGWKTIGRDDSGRPVWFFQHPASDPKSSWLTIMTGEDSDRAMMTYWVDKYGVDMSSLRYLQPGVQRKNRKARR